MRSKKIIRQFNKLTAIFLILIVFAGIMPLSASARNNVPTVKIGYYENEVFQEGAGEGLVKSGYAYEYYIKLSEYTGWKYEYVYGSYSDLYKKLIDGEIDMLAGLAWKEDREKIIGYPEAAMGSETYNLVKHDSDDKITSDTSTLNGVKIGVLESALEGVLRNFLKTHNINAEVKTFSDYETLFSEFDKKSIDILAAEGDGAYGRNHAEVLCSFGSSDYYLCVNKKKDDLLKELNDAQEMLSAEEPNYLNYLRTKYYSVSVSSRAFSLPEKEWLNSRDEIKIGYLKNYLPYSDTGSDGKVTGLISEYVEEIIKDLGIKNLKVSYTEYSSYDDMIDALNSGKTDTAFPVGGGLYYSEENGMYQTNPVVSSPPEFVYLNDFDDNTITHFAVNENNRMQYYYIKTNYPKAKITMYQSIDECLESVLSGETNCTTLNGLRAYDIMKNNKYKKLSLRQLGTNDDRCFGVKIGNEGLLKLLNRGINVAGKDYAQNLAYRYTEGLYIYSAWDFILDNMLAIVLLLTVIAALIILLLIRDSRRKKKQIELEETARLELESKNAELARSKEALSDALVAADHANRAKTVFLNNMSHDIRTPMNAIVGFTAMASANIDNKDQVRDCLDKISVSSRHLVALINDVLDMSRIESGKMKIEESEVHLPDVIYDLRTIIQSNLKAKKQELFIETKDVKNEDIITDKLRLNQILLNILTNAVKFTPEGGKISFCIIEKPSEIESYTQFEFRIKDNGIGMSEEFQKTIFEAFARERSSTVSGIQGTGLGMAITKNIVDLMNGTITVNSTEGKGSEFIVNIPCKISEKTIKYEKLPELEGLRVLVVNENTDTCLSVSEMLSEIGMSPVSTTQGMEAVSRAGDANESGDKFSAYIIDLDMPDLNGIETVRRIRKVTGGEPIIILTAYDLSGIESEAREAGVTAICLKPLFMSELRQALIQAFITDKAKAPEKTDEPDFSGKRVLLAEDNEMNQLIAVSILEGSGFEVEIAGDGKKALNMVESADAGYYDVVLMDIQMPHMDGYEAAKRIRQLSDSEKSSIPIIAVTANAFEEDRKIALEAGMNGYLAKPYDIPMIMQTLSELLE